MSKKENYPGFRLTELWLFVSIDADDDEGVMAFTMPHGGTWMPMVAADVARRESLIPVADKMIQMNGGRYEVRHFVRERSMFDEIVENADRQLMIRGLAVQSLTSPGFEFACRELAKKLKAEEIFDSFRESMGDLYE